MKLVNVYQDGNYLRVLRREADGSLSQSVFPAAFVTWHRLDGDWKLTFDHEGWTHTAASASDHGEWKRIRWSSEAGWKLAPQYMECFEADVRPAQRFLVEQEVEFQQPRRVFMDLETDSRVPFSEATEGHARILSWALVDESGNVTKEVLKFDTDHVERSFLTRLWFELKRFDQIIAWNGDEFDFPVLVNRSTLLGLRIDSKIWLWLDQMKVFARMNSAESGEEKTSLKLQAVAEAILGEGKDPVDGSRTWEYWFAGGEKRQDLLAYNVKDTLLLKRIEDKTGFIALMQTICESTGVRPNSNGLNPVSQVDAFMLRMGYRLGVHFPTKKFVEDAQFKGAYVMQPTEQGILRDVHVADFRRLYPSIIITWNMSPETLSTRGIGSRVPVLVDGKEVYFENERVGILPSALKRMTELREEWAKKKAECTPGTPEWFDADRRSTAYKVAANSFYGVIGSPYSRYFNKVIAESVTQTGVHLIQLTKSAAEIQNMRVVYADTDSIFVMGSNQESFGGFVKWCNEVLYPVEIKGYQCRENDIHLAYEKAFERIVFVSAKRYAGRFAHYKGKVATSESKPEIKGLEFKRGDAARLARQLQEKAIHYILAGEERLEAYRLLLSEMRNRVAFESLDVKDVAVSKSLSRKPNEYQSPPVHARVALELEARGERMNPGSRVSYVIVNNRSKPPKAIPASDYTGEFDREYLWQNLIYPPTLRLLQAAFPAHDWERENDLFQLQVSLFSTSGDVVVRPMRTRAKKG